MLGRGPRGCCLPVHCEAHHRPYAPGGRQSDNALITGHWSHTPGGRQSDCVVFRKHCGMHEECDSCSTRNLKRLCILEAGPRGCCSCVLCKAHHQLRALGERQ
eukprot:scaffold22438_cov21-Tisochrysis_lutea.AAC.3